MTLPRALRSIRTRLTLWYTGVLLVILLVIGGFSYQVLAWSLYQDVDASLVTVGRVIRDTGYADSGAIAEAALRELLGPDFVDKFFQLRDPAGNPGGASASLRNRELPLTPVARANAARGRPTFETLELPGGERARVLTLPVANGSRLPGLVQVGISLARAEDALHRYLMVLLAAVPVGLALAAVGGALIARAALAPVNLMARTARRITAEDLAQRVAASGSGDELDYLAETLNEMLARLEEAFGEMRRFAADTAHELRTPLTALKGGIEVALRAARSPHEYRRVLEESLEEVNRLIRAAEDLLLLTRAGPGRGLARERLNLEPIVIDALETGARLAQGTGVTVRLGAVEPVEVVGDASALRRAILNLVENAVKYTAAGGKVEMTLAREGDHALIAVADTGVGIAPADLERIFEPFVRLDAASATPGSGLGLAIARGVAVAHAGGLTVESTPGAGSRFTLRLPLA
ncbi:MAG TPA: ATP-binding protein [Verrucomicrobiae bacterium]|nr:ATP-binding protein [Verrucomicrobiae bacterium]